MFPESDEILLAEFWLDLANLSCGLRSLMRKFAYQFAQANNKQIPPNWNTNEEALTMIGLEDLCAVINNYHYLLQNQQIFK